MKKKPRYLHDGDEWILAEEIPDIDFQFSQIWLSSFVNDLEKTIGTNYRKTMAVYDDGYNLKFYYGKADSERVSRVILEKILDGSFGITVNKNIRKVADELQKAIKDIESGHLSNLTNKELGIVYANLDDIHTRFYTWCWLPNAVDMFHPHLTDHLKGVLAEYFNTESEINAALVALSSSDEKSFVQEEMESLLHIAIQKTLHPEAGSIFEELLAKHHESFFYLRHLWIGKDGVSTIDEYRASVKQILKDSDPETELAKEQERWVYDKQLKQDYVKRLDLSAKEQLLFQVYADFAYTKSYRRKVQLYWAYKMDFVFQEVSKRLGITFMESRFLMPIEVQEGLRKDLPESLRESVKLRTKHCVYYAENDLDIIAVKKDCEIFEKTISEEFDLEVKEFHGQVACIGKVVGKVKIVNVPADIQKVYNGDVLVSIATNPDILPAMKRAVAFVTEQGGITSHAAIIAREMKKPCIIGTKIATKVLKDGDVVEVDADRGIVTVLKREDK